MKIFIGSSSEAADNTNPKNILLKVAEILREAGVEPVAWNNSDYDLFSVGNTTIENLETIVEREQIGASVFIFSADDKIWWRDKVNGKSEDKNAPRDNVIFEHGLFSGKLGRKKSIIVKCGEVEKMPSDLYGVTSIDLSKENREAGTRKLIQWVNNLKTEISNDTNSETINTKPRVFCEYHADLEKEKAAIEQELSDIKGGSGILTVFKKQSDAVKDYKENISNPDISSIKILCIRGESFVQDQDEQWGSVFDDNRSIIGILSSDNNLDLIKSRYESCKKRNETEDAFITRYTKQMKSTQETIKSKKSNQLYLYYEKDLPFRMLFIDNILYMSKFKKNTKASQLEVIKIQKDSTLYSVCEEYYEKIKSTAVKQHE
ncbi:MAG: nucleotide-binding protein [Bacteroidales bacterium]|jgi:hypothetical protein|nr:nucleotide-binding protein [Bacteroidales bacterium]